MVKTSEGLTEIDRETGLAQEINTALHRMTQPLTALLFILEVGAGTDDVEEMKMAISQGLEQCGRLTGSVRAMQTLVRQAIESDGT